MQNEHKLKSFDEKDLKMYILFFHKNIAMFPLDRHLRQEHIGHVRHGNK